MSNKNFDEETIKNFVNSMKYEDDEFVPVGYWLNGLEYYKEKNNGGAVKDIKTLKNLKKSVLLEAIQKNPNSKMAKEYNKFQFKDIADLKKEDLLDMLPLSNGSIQDLINFVDDFCLDAKDFDEAIYILLTRRLDRRRRIDGLRLIKTKLKFISKFKKDSLSWKQIEKIWAIGDDQQAHYNSFSDHIDIVYSALETIKKDQPIAYETSFIKNDVLNMLREADPSVKCLNFLPHLKSEKRQRLGDYLFGVIYMLLIHSKEYLENRKMDALNDFFGSNKKGSFSSKIGSNILDLISGNKNGLFSSKIGSDISNISDVIQCSFVKVLSIVYLKEGYFEKSKDEHVVKLREILKENKCELKVDKDEQGNLNIVFKNNQEKTVEQSLADNELKEQKGQNVSSSAHNSGEGLKGKRNQDSDKNGNNEVENNQKDNLKITFKNNQEKMLEQPLKNMEGKIVSDKNFGQSTITNFVSSMKGHDGKILYEYKPWVDGLNSYKKKNNGGTVKDIETFKNLKKNVLLEAMRVKPNPVMTKKYGEFQFKDTADLKKEDLLNMLPLNSGRIQDLLDLVDDFCLDAKDFKEFKKIFSNICITTEKSDLCKVNLKFISKFKKGSLTWQQFKTIWAIDSAQQMDSVNIYFSNYVDTVYSALETLKKNQQIAYDASFIKNCVVNVLRPNNADVKTEEIEWQINQTKSEERQRLGDCLFGVIYMMLIHSKEYLEDRKMDALNDFFGSNKKGSFSSKISSNILELVRCGFVGALSIAYLNEGYFEKSKDEHVVKLREILKENKCELKVNKDKKGNFEIVFKNNQEKMVEDHSKNVEGKIMSDKNFDKDAIIKAFVDIMKDGQGKSLVKLIPWKKGLNAYRQKNKNLLVTEIAKVKNLKQDVLMEVIQTSPNSEIAKKYAEFQFEDTAGLKKEDLLNMLPLPVLRIDSLLDLVSVSCLSAEDFEEAKKIFFNIHNGDDGNYLALVKLKFISKFKKGSLTWQQWKQVEETWIIDGNHDNDISLKFNYIDVVYLALEAFKEDSEISFGDATTMFNILMGDFWDAGNKKVEDPESLEIEDIQKLGDCLFGVIYMLLIHSKEYLEDRKMDALNGFFGQCEANTFYSAIGNNLLELLDATFAEKLAILYLNNGYFKTSKNEYVIKLREMLEENKCELKVEKDETGESKIVFKNNQEKTVEQSLSSSEQTEQKEQGINNSANSDDKKSNEKKLKWKGNENSDKDKNNIAGNEEEEKPKIVPVKNNQEQIVQKAEGGELKTQGNETEDRKKGEEQKDFKNFKMENGKLTPCPTLFKIENGKIILNNTQTGIHNKNENENKEESKTPIGFVILSKIAYVALCILTLGILPLVEWFFAKPKISKIDQSEPRKSILTDTSENKNKDEDVDKNIKLEGKDNEYRDVK